MQKLTTIIVLLIVSITLTHGQNMTTREVKKIADKFVEKLNAKNLEIHNIIISDFTDGKVAPTEFGRFLAEEFSYYISDLDDEKFTVLDR